MDFKSSEKRSKYDWIDNARQFVTISNFLINILENIFIWSFKAQIASMV